MLKNTEIAIQTVINSGRMSYEELLQLWGDKEFVVMAAERLSVIPSELFQQFKNTPQMGYEFIISLKNG